MKYIASMEKYHKLLNNILTTQENCFLEFPQDTLR